MPDATEKIVITAGEVSRADRPSRPPRLLPWWAVAASALAALSLPILCIYAIVVRAVIRHRDSRLRAAWTRLLCSLLISSGLISSLVVAYFWGVASTPVPVQLSFGLDSLDGLDSFPALPSAQAMAPSLLASTTKPLVFIAAPDPGRPPARNYLDMAPLGAATLLSAQPAGYLFATNRHVIEETGMWKLRASNGRMLLYSSKGDYAAAGVVARHRSLDLALLWIGRKAGVARFRQPVAHFDSVPVGEQVFVIGHPQRLFFTLSNGLISRREGRNLLQLSAPISPGNSGGPVYDDHGNLLGIVTFKVDKQTSPNAENLNFAVRADALVDEQGWEFQQDGRARLQEFCRPAAK